MSTDTPAAFVDLDARDDPDPYGIVPDDFVDRFEGAETIPEALAAAQRQRGTTDLRRFRRCRRCLSIKLHSKPGVEQQSNERDEPVVCNNCDFHQYEPLPPAAEIPDALVPDNLRQKFRDDLRVAYQVVGALEAAAALADEIA